MIGAFCNFAIGIAAIVIATAIMVLARHMVMP